MMLADTKNAPIPWQQTPAAANASFMLLPIRTIVHMIHDSC
jgi:hypothetical protein